MFVLTEFWTSTSVREIGIEELFSVVVPALYKNEMQSQLIL